MNRIEFYKESDRIAGVLLGTAVGDSLGLPAEGIGPRRLKRLFPVPWRHCFVLGRGMISDDTEHTLFVAQSLLECGEDPQAFQRALARRLRWWLAALPAGCGLATLRACLRLWLAVPCSRSGVWSAGNGPAMRSAIIGACFWSEPQLVENFVRASTTLTHRDPRALVGSLAVARGAAWGMSHGPAQSPDDAAVLAILGQASADDAEWPSLVSKILAARSAGLSVAEFVASLGLDRGVSGYVYHTVPVAIYAWLRHWGDFRGALSASLACGGDTDTVGAIVGALCGATVGEAGIPIEWVDGICDWPRSVGLLRKVADRLAQQQKQVRPLGAVRYAWPAVVPRNLFFLAIVLCHAFRRLVPPY